MVKKKKFFLLFFKQSLAFELYSIPIQACTKGKRRRLCKECIFNFFLKLFSLSIFWFFWNLYLLREIKNFRRIIEENVYLKKQFGNIRVLLVFPTGSLGQVLFELSSTLHLLKLGFVEVVKLIERTCFKIFRNLQTCQVFRTKPWLCFGGSCLCQYYVIYWTTHK